MAINLDTLDKVFEVVFARFRRKMGDRNLEAAWRRASIRVLTYVGWAMAAVLIVLLAVFFTYFAVDVPPEHKRWGQMLAAAVGVLISILLDRRFTKYLAAPPQLSQQESSIDALLVLRFRAACYAVFAIVCVVGFLLHESGARILPGPGPA